MALPLPPDRGGLPDAAGGDLRPPLAAPAPRTYRELYSDASNGPALDRLGGYLAGYRFTDGGGAGVPTPVALRDQTVTLSDRQPMSFLALVPGHEGAPEIAILHRVLRYMDMPGDDPSGYHDHVLGLLGDILPHQYPVVEVPNTTFHLVGTAVRVPTMAAMDTLLPTWVDPGTALGPYAEVDPETEVVRPRHVQLIPSRYAALLIHRRRARPKSVYQELVGVMRAEGTLESCQDVTIWLRAACTARGGGGAQTAVPSVLHVFTPVHLPPEVYQYVTSKVQSDLPALRAADGVGGGATAQLVGALQALAAARRDAAEEADEAGARGAGGLKTIAQAYKETYTSLLRFGNVGNVEEVAPLWTRLANCGKGEQHTVLTQEFQKVCMARGLSTELYVPIITTSLKQMVVGFQFEGQGADDLTTGCQPFIVAYAGRTSHYQAMAAAAVANQLSYGEQNANLSDIRTIREQERVKFPRDLSEVCITLFRFAVLCQGLFQGVGAPHPFVEAMWIAAAGLQNIAPFVTERIAELAPTPQTSHMYCARIVRAIQLEVQEYMQRVATNVADNVVGIEVPTFSNMYQDLRRGTFHLSTNWVNVPEEYLGAFPHSSGSEGSSGRQVPGAASISTASTRSTVSTLTGDATRTSGTNVTRVENPTVDTEFTTMALRPGGARAILRTHRPPANDAGQEFCVAWWTKGGCFPNCGRRATHVPFASAAERTRLLAFIREHLAVPAGGAAM